MYGWKKSRWYVGFLFVLSVVGCVEEPVAPLRGSLALNASASEARGRYVVVFHSSNTIPDDFAAAVAGLGGTVDFAMTQVGAALVSNLSASNAAELARDTRVLSVDRDVPIPTHAQRMRLTAPHMISLAGELNSPAAPQLAGLFALQWNMAAIQAPAAWAAGLVGSPGVTVAILDSGIDEGSEAVAAQRNIDLLFRVDRQRSISFMPEEDAVVEQVFGPDAPLYTDLDGHKSGVEQRVQPGGSNITEPAHGGEGLFDSASAGIA
jgi:hypothetical protein